MALTFSDKLNGMHFPFGGRQFRAYEITHDGSETSIDASDLGLTYIETAIPGGGTVPVGSAGTTAQIDLTTNNGSSLAMTALSSGAKTIIWAIGY
jgi:hypothetical protein